MLVNAHSIHFPALWQGLMLCALPFYIWLSYKSDGRYYKLANWLYGGFGAFLIVAMFIFA